MRRGRARRMPSLVLQALARPENGRPPRFGFTVTKRVGSAVVRNRARRRLKEAVRLVAPELARPGFDYVVIGRHGALSHRFCDILDELRTALKKIHDERAPRPGRR
ncbi:MAG: ribonuclease P protein component [Hyphomicrobiales bacterium]|nr:ribonuclease P protein component [Hyphomicrobiales bacterium]